MPNEWTLNKEFRVAILCARAAEAERCAEMAWPMAIENRCVRMVIDLSDVKSRAAELRKAAEEV